ncbi:MAG: DUF1559 domain-containing protein [Gemmataceae bacterium]|nr:DUF1559 domain-containing protein [Gemmata sp.]MDW8197686.1 DUF1559 domain-containing protein [Gemmataceae bacterium]
MCCVHLRIVTVAALIVSLGFLALPACKKKPKSPATDSSNNPANTPPEPHPNPYPNPTPGEAGFAAPPSTPIFSAATAGVMQRLAQENAQQIGQALQDFHAAYGFFPAGYADSSGQLGLSWRVALLPFLEQENLFRQFKLNEPWNSEHNRKLIDKMPKVFRPGNQDTFGYTFFRGFTGPNTWLPPLSRKGEAGQLLPGVSMAQISDGLANTILVAEAATPVIWTKPDELVFAPNNVPKIGGGVFPTGAIVIFSDGRPQFVKKSIAEQTLAAAITINGGEIVNWEN